MRGHPPKASSENRSRRGHGLLFRRPRPRGDDASTMAERASFASTATVRRRGSGGNNRSNNNSGRDRDEERSNQAIKQGQPEQQVESASSSGEEEGSTIVVHSVPIPPTAPLPYTNTSGVGLSTDIPGAISGSVPVPTFNDDPSRRRGRERAVRAFLDQQWDRNPSRVRMNHSPASAPGSRRDNDGRGYVSDPNGRPTPRQSNATAEAAERPNPRRGQRSRQSRSVTLGSTSTSTQGRVGETEGRTVREAPLGSPIVVPTAQDPSRPSGPRRRATHDSVASVNTALSALSLQSDCQVRRNSIRFRHDDPEDYDANSLNSDNSSYISGDTMEVMDLRPSNHSAVHRMETSSLVSLSSNLSIDSELASGLFQVASAHNTASFNRGMQEIGDALRGDLPRHWERAGAGYTHPADGAAGGIAENPLGESEEAYRALMSLMRDGPDEEIAVGGVHNNNMSSLSNNDGAGGGYRSAHSSGSHGSSAGSGGGMRRRESFASVETGVSGFWSAIGPLHAGLNSLAGDAASTSGSESSSELSPLTQRKRQRKMYVRRCARAMAVFAVLAALSVGTIALASDDGFDAFADILPDSVVGFFSSSEEDEQRYRKLPQDYAADGEVVVPPPPQEGPGGTGDVKFKNERQLQRMRERATKRRAERKAAKLEAHQRDVQRRAMVVQPRETMMVRPRRFPEAQIAQEPQRRTMTVQEENGGYYHPQEGYFVHQDQQFGQGGGGFHEEYHPQGFENQGQPLMDPQRRALAYQEQQVMYENHFVQDAAHQEHLAAQGWGGHQGPY